MALSKEQILDEIKRTAKENGSKPLGTDRFEKETGIKPYDWGKYWARFSDAQKEAGLMPNQLNSAYTDEFLFEKLIGLIRKLGKFPTYKEFRIEKNEDDKFPDGSVFQRFGSKQQLIEKVIEYCKAQDNHGDVIALSETVLKEVGSEEDSTDSPSTKNIGEVYLFKSGKYYKIGKTNDTVRRGNELRIQLPENLDLIHSIKTDDTSGIEAYWHRRFENKRMNGEWFDLDSSDIKAFKRWKRIV
ncbi:hypothetical protein A2765_03900 [Candidatus Kaiserbacteria bacterium RIFCSPHIGHO2_01_FULL_56_24]|uniref:Bacteriophage T5 Orf172 DNA-binding domain-containing protein n=1 Tax=Candidatus Kaiserbacteria bacterium RIFCSPHIGHO2_01_FULL_56_24 TaxID=1798487 RepID=A0A1F6DE52_9BACT|nr:MAG: hypothetical protein A2765_03900 [Candidatus Kaiserbacteria bacterium RIFCSPHIGHO2_01_FULL_56_24]